jgi:NAD(P)-dependent dehydrogenase (short-subunit alcohol dehydrogenase family)
VTGSSRGLGADCAKGFGREGAAVVVTARTIGDEALGVLKAIEAEGGMALAVACDVADPIEIEAMVAATLARFGRIDILLANAVFYAPGGFMTIDPRDWRRQFDVNVHGVFDSIRAVAPTMIKQGDGHIITVSSVAAERASHYGATKRAVVGLTLGFATELAGAGVSVNALRPVAAVATPGWLGSRPAEALEARAHRVSPPDSYVEAAILLGSQSASVCSGQQLTDAEVIRRFGDAASLERFSAMNAAVWSESLNA